jgi:hypothetical protein
MRHQAGYCRRVVRINLPWILSLGTSDFANDVAIEQFEGRTLFDFLQLNHPVIPLSTDPIEHPRVLRQFFFDCERHGFASVT